MRGNGNGLSIERALADTTLTYMCCGCDSDNSRAHSRVAAELALCTGGLQDPSAHQRHCRPCIHSPFTDGIQVGEADAGQAHTHRHRQEDRHLKQIPSRRGAIHSITIILNIIISKLIMNYEVLILSGRTRRLWRARRTGRWRGGRSWCGHPTPHAPCWSFIHQTSNSE